MSGVLFAANHISMLLLRHLCSVPSAALPVCVYVRLFDARTT
jgi:hypothetical protein